MGDTLTLPSRNEMRIGGKAKVSAIVLQMGGSGRKSPGREIMGKATLILDPANEFSSG